jgi:hypothetical protein
MSAVVNLTGRWVGHYVQHDRPHPIAADLVQAGHHLSGRMHDEETDSERSVYDVASEAGLPPGADEQIVARLREAVPDESGPIRYVTHLPPESVLEGRVDGETVSFLKRYQGVHFGGFKVGEQMIGSETSSHAVHYAGRLVPGGDRIEGTWWISGDPQQRTRRTEGLFELRRLPQESA